MSGMNPTERDACRAWQLLMRFFFAQRAHLPASGAEFDPLAGSVPRAALDRAGAPAAHEPPRRHAVVRCLERHRADRSAGVPRAPSAPTVHPRPPRESPSTDPNRLAGPDTAAQAHGGAVSSAVAALSRAAANAGGDPRGARRREVDLNGQPAPRFGIDHSS
jgi:hypothetical protein